MNRPLLDPGSVATSSSRVYDYDVTLSWNSEGAEQPSVDNLYGALVRSGLRTFKDDDMLSRKIIRTLDILKAREQSMISIIVLSKAFADSEVLFEELGLIIKYSSISKYLVLPVFYDVDDPSEIWNGNAGAAFPNYKQRVCHEVSDLMAFILPKEIDTHAPRIIQRFVGFIQDGLKTNKISSWGSKVCQLMDSGLSKLPENMKFPVLKELFLQDNYNLLEIPLSFFEFMPFLQVLDMSRTSIKYLPPSISNLVELQKLFLRGCKLLMELPIEIRSLENLDVFDLSGTELIYIPKEIKMLRNLESLQMSLCACADEYISEITEIIPRKTLSELSNLKELSIYVDLDCKWWGEVVDYIIQDLGSMEKLETVKLTFPSVGILQRFLQLQKICQSLSNFRLVVGHDDQRVISRLPQELQDEFETLEKCLKFVNGTGDTNEVAQAFKYARTLFLDRHWTIDRLSIFKFEMNNLRFCLLVECNEMKTVIDGLDFYPEGDNVEKPVLGLLQFLSIHYMKNLASIWAGPFASGSLSNLQILAFYTCPKLTTIFDFELLCNLLSLKEIIVEDCPKVESLVRVESSYLESDEEFLPSLEKISLLHLPGLVSISSSLRIAPRLVSIVVYDCPKLQSLSPLEMSCKYIKEIKGETEWWEALETNSSQLNLFDPLGGDDLMNQLAEARTLSNTLSTIQKAGENEVPVKILESEDNVSYNVYFDKTHKDRTIAGKITNPNDSKENPDMFSAPDPAPVPAPVARRELAEPVVVHNAVSPTHERRFSIENIDPKLYSASPARDLSLWTGIDSEVPRFGDWEDKYPSSADSYTPIFNKVRDKNKKKDTGKSAVQKLYEICKQVFANSKAGYVPPPSDIKRLQLVLDSIKPSDVGLSPSMFKKIKNQEAHRVIYVHIYECDKFSIGIFCLPPSALIPLHNHPGMTVFSKLLFGSMHVKSYDWVDINTSAPAPANQINLSHLSYGEHPGGVRLAKVHTDSEIKAPCKSSILYPEAGGNMHSFKALTPCAILDVQGPPYSDDEGRHCTYYRHHPYARFSEMVVVDGEEKEEYAWLEEREIPDDFFVVRESYQGPNILDS